MALTLQTGCRPDYLLCEDKGFSYVVRLPIEIIQTDYFYSILFFLPLSGRSYGPGRRM